MSYYRDEFNVWFTERVRYLIDKPVPTELLYEAYCAGVMSGAEEPVAYWNSTDADWE
jgi:hypothetical protein